jgi:hypothetical protein
MTSEETRIQLKFPVDFGSQKVDELVVRRGRLGDLKGIVIGDVVAVSDLMLVASRMTGQPVGVIERLDEEDSGPLMRIVQRFFRTALGTGLAG